MLERLQLGSAIFGQAREKLDLLLGVAELTVTMPQKSDAALVARKGIFEVGGAVFEFAEDGFEFSERLLEAQRWRLGWGHDASRAGRRDHPCIVTNRRGYRGASV